MYVCSHKLKRKKNNAVKLQLLWRDIWHPANQTRRNIQQISVAESDVYIKEKFIG